MADQRTARERWLWQKIGPPLYYCSDCLRAVKVRVREGADPLIERPCGTECGAGIIAPRSAVCVGEGGMTLPTRARIAAAQIKALITGRCV
jgi:hypothetical protein